MLRAGNYTGCAFFDTAHASMYFDVFQDATVSATAGRLSGYGIVGGVTAYTRVRCARRVSLVPANEIIMGWWLDQGAGPSGGGFVRYIYASVFGTGGLSAAAKQVSLMSDGDGKAYFTRGDDLGTTISGPTTANILTSGTRYVEIRIVVDPTAGVVELRIDNQVKLRDTGLNTQNLSTAVIGGWEVVPWTIDDIYVVDRSGSRNNSYLGKGFHVLDLRPTAAGDATEWDSSSGGSNYACVDEQTPDDGATNVRAPYPGRVDQYTMADMSDDLTVFALQANAFVSKSALTSIAQYANGVRIGAADFYAANKIVPATAYRLLQDVWELAPDDLTPWTKTKINASQSAVLRAL